MALDFLDHSYNIEGLGEQLVEADDEEARQLVSVTCGGGSSLDNCVKRSLLWF